MLARLVCLILGHHWAIWQEDIPMSGGISRLNWFCDRCEYVYIYVGNPPEMRD